MDLINKQKILGVERSVIIGLMAGLGLLLLYFVLLTLANSFSHAVSQFYQFWYWILSLAAGFGLQVGLYAYIHERMRALKTSGSIAASGTLSVGSMVACCVHHFTDVLPLLGLAGLALFLSEYQIFFFSLGLFSNLVGVAIMIEIITKHQLAGDRLKKIIFFNTSQFKKIAIIFAVILLPAIFFVSRDFSNAGTSTQELEPNEVILKAQTSEANGITFIVTPKDFDSGGNVSFNIQIDTHAGSLDYDLAQISALEDGEGNRYVPLEWSGSAPGGHHREGTLSFPALKDPSDALTLYIQDDEEEKRIFKWELR